MTNVTIALVALLSMRAEAQTVVSTRVESRVTPQLALARICAKEEGWAVTDGCAGIHAVLVRGAARTGISYLAFARAYSPSAFRPRSGREWFADLQPDGREPRGWPPGAAWGRYRARWLALYAHAGAAPSGPLGGVCAQPPRHWGGAMDYVRPKRYRWVRVECGDARNLFWVPRREAIFHRVENPARPGPVR